MSDEMNNKNVFGIRNFRLVFFGALASGLGTMLYSFAVSFHILKISGNSALLQGIYLAVCGIVMLIFTPIGGVVGDRFDKVKIMYFCDFLYGGLILLGTALMAIFSAAGAQIAVLFFMGICGNAISGVFAPASGALLPVIVPVDKLQQANAYTTICSSFQGIIGVILAGILYSTVPVLILFASVGICFILSGISETLIRAEHIPSAEKLSLKMFRTDMAEGLRYVLDRRELSALLIAVLFLNFFSAPLASSFFPYFVKTDIASAPSYLFEQLLTPELWSSVFSMIMGIGGIIGAAVLSARPQAEKCGYTIAKRLAFLSCMIILITAGYFALVRGGRLNVYLLLVALVCFIFGFTISLINVPISTALIRMVDREKLSKVNSIAGIGSQGLIPIASLLAGILLQSFGCGGLLVYSSVGYTLVALLMLRSKSIRNF